MKKFVRFVDTMNERIGKVACLLILPMAGITAYKIIMSRVFEVSSSWCFETTVYIYGVHFMFGMAAAYLYDRHVRIDIIVLQLPRRVQLWLRIITFLLIFVPFIGALTYGATVYAAHSWQIWEQSSSGWKTPLYPYKTVMPVTIFFLFLQGIANFIRDCYELKGEEI